MAVGLYRAHSRTQCVRNRLVAFATYDEFKDLPLAWCQFCDPRKNGVPLEDSSARLFRAVMDGSGTTAPVIPPRARSEARCDHSGPVQANQSKLDEGRYNPGGVNVLGRSTHKVNVWTGGTHSAVRFHRANEYLSACAELARVRGCRMPSRSRKPCASTRARRSLRARLQQSDTR